MAYICSRTQPEKGFGKGSGRNSGGPLSPGLWGRQTALSPRGLQNLSNTNAPQPLPSEPIRQSDEGELATKSGGPQQPQQQLTALEPLKNDSTRKCV